MHNTPNAEDDATLILDEYPPIQNRPPTSGKDTLMTKPAQEIDAILEGISVVLARRALNDEAFEFASPADAHACTLTWPQLSNVISKEFDIAGKLDPIKKSLTRILNGSNIQFNSSGRANVA